MSDKPSKFAGILRSHQEETPPDEPQRSEAAAPAAETKPKASTATGKRPRGRPAGQGKRLNPDYAQVTAYIPAQLHTETKINLLRQSKKLEFSELVEELLSAWNRKQSQGHAAS